jgi:F-type H+-transporting ATPase subunit delta
MAKLISKTYGEALYELAVEENKVDVLLEEASMVKEIIISNCELEQFMNHPQITKDEKVNLIQNSFKGRVLDEITGFLTIIVERRRFSEVIEIFDYFISAIKDLINI